MFTSYYAKTKNILEAGLMPVAISIVVPRWAGKIARYQALAPRHNMLRLSDEPFTFMYEHYILGKLEPGKVYDDLLSAGPESKIVLLCYEKPPKFCHRRLAAAWLSEALGIQIPELVLRPPESGIQELGLS